MNSKVLQTIEQAWGPEARTGFPGSAPSSTRELGNHTQDGQSVHLESGLIQSAATAVLISADSSLVQACQRVIDSIPGLTLAVIDSTEKIDSFLGREDVILVLKHVVRRNETTEAVRLLYQTASLGRSLAVLVISDEYVEDYAWSLGRLGAVDYLSRPLNLDRLTSILDTFTISARSTRVYAPAVNRPPCNGNPQAAVLPSLNTPMSRLLAQIRVVAPQENTVLLTGETGTGKTWLARLIHELSPRRTEPLLTINCGALATELIESEMFGHVKGAFTGADRTRTGKFAASGRGTLLLDEIDALPLVVQSKLLRAVDERIFEPVGSNNSFQVRARLIAASNRLLEQEVKAGRFRDDLYHRLNVIGFHVPPLRERPEDILGMATKFVAEFASRNSRPARNVSASALQALLAYRWPGNVRELRNAIERAVVLCHGPEIRPDHLPEIIGAAASCRNSASCLDPGAYPGPAPPPPLDRARAQVEIERIIQALERYGNNRLRAAAALGISRRTLYKKLHRYSLGAIKESPADRYARGSK